MTLQWPPSACILERSLEQAWLLAQKSASAHEAVFDQILCMQLCLADLLLPQDN